MRFLLYCNQDPRALGIEDAQGNLNYDLFRKHIDTCPECARFKLVIPKDLLDGLEHEFKKNKGDQLNDRPSNLKSLGQGERDS